MDMVDNSTSLFERLSGWMFVIGPTRLTTSSRGEASFEFFCWHLHRLPRDMILLPHLACVALKRKSAAMATRAPLAPSIIGWFCRQPWPGYIGDSVVPPICHRALVAARALLAVSGGDAQSGNRLATTPGVPVGVGTAEPSPTGAAFHGGG